MASPPRPRLGRRLRLAVTAVAGVAALAVAGWVPGQAAAAQATAPAAAPAPTAFRGFVLSNGRYTKFDVPGDTTKTVVGGSNDRSQLVGGYTDARGEHGFLRDTSGRITRIDVPGARSTSAAKLNDRGQLVGVHTQTGLLEDPNSPHRGYLLDRGRFVRIDFPDAVDTQTLGINNRGQVVGQYVDAAGGFHGFVWERGRYRTVDAPDTVGTFLTDINDRGQLLGGRVEPDGTVRGFVMEQGRSTTFAPQGVVFVASFDINNRGQTVGSGYRDPAATAGQGFLLAKGPRGGFTPINFPGAANTVVAGINDRGLIVGGYQDASAAPSPQRERGNPPLGRMP
jgi:YD repeat-containing protein